MLTYGQTNPTFRETLEVAVSAISEHIEAMIAAGRFAVGERIPAERQLALELGVSRSSLREAIKQLVSRGLLTTRHGGGTYVTSPETAEPLRVALQSLAPLAASDAGYWRDVIEIRKSLEGDAAAYAALRAGPDDRAAIAAAYRALAAALMAPAASAPADAPRTLATLDAGFHQLIARAAHNAVLYQLMCGLEGLLEASISDSLAQLYRLPGLPAQLDSQHRQILDAILAGQPAAARTAATEHLLFVEEQLERLEQAAARRKRATHAFSQLRTAKASVA